MALQGTGDPEDDSDLDPCFYCGTELHRASDDWVFLHVSWGSVTVNAHEGFTFCTQAHAAAYLAENTLPEPEPPDLVPTPPTLGSRLRTIGVVLLVVWNLAIYVLGLVAWVRWVWS